MHKAGTLSTPPSRIEQCSATKIKNLIKECDLNQKLHFHFLDLFRSTKQLKFSKFVTTLNQNIDIGIEIAI